MILRATSEFICWILPSTYKALPHAVASKAYVPSNSLKSQVREAKAVGHRADAHLLILLPSPRTRGEGQGVRGFALCFDWFLIVNSMSSCDS